MIDAATLAPLRALARRVLELCDIDAACVLMVARGKTPTETAAELSRICAPGGEADRLADVLEKNPQAAKDYASRLAAQFAPFAEIVRSMTPGGDVRYFRQKLAYMKTTAADATPEEAAERLNVKRMVVFEYIREGKLVGVYRDGKRNPYGVTRQSLEAYAEKQEMRKAATLAKAQAKADRMAEKKQHGGIYYTEDGRKIHGAERISRSEAAQLLNFHELTVTAICRRGEIAHVYADPACTIPCGYTRASVEAWAQAHPRHIPARKAQAIPDFMIAPLPPPPRKHGLRAARLDPDATGEAAGEKPAAVIEGATVRPQRRKPKSDIVFMLAAWNAATTSEEKERNMENETNEKPAEAATPTAPGKLEIAKAYTVHEAGVIRAICVSEADRDEIVEALRLYRRARAKPGEVESALQLLRAVREIVGTSATAEPEAPDATPAAAGN